MPEDTLHQVGQTLEQLRALPWAAHALAAGALAAGLVLWLIGRRVLKPMVVVLFALIGAAVGFVAVPMTFLAGNVSVYVGLLVGLAIGSLLGVILFRFAMAVGLGLVLGVAAPLTVAAVMSFRADHEPPPPDPQRVTQQANGEPDGDADTDRLPAKVTEEVIRRQIENLKKQLNPSEEDGAAPADNQGAGDGASKPEDAKALEEMMRSAGERVRAFAQAVGEDIAAGWGQLSPSHRLMLTGSAGVGLAVGIILGVVVPAWSAGMVTALLGAGVWLTSAAWLLLAMNVPGGDHLQRPAREWLVIWLGVAGLGMLVQWAGLMRKKRKKGKDDERR